MPGNSNNTSSTEKQLFSTSSKLDFFTAEDMIQLEYMADSLSSKNNMIFSTQAGLFIAGLMVHIYSAMNNYLKDFQNIKEALQDPNTFYVINVISGVGCIVLKLLHSMHSEIKLANEDLKTANNSLSAIQHLMNNHAPDEKFTHHYNEIIKKCGEILKFKNGKLSQVALIYKLRDLNNLIGVIDFVSYLTTSIQLPTIFHGAKAHLLVYGLEKAATFIYRFYTNPNSAVKEHAQTLQNWCGVSWDTVKEPILYFSLKLNAPKQNISTVITFENQDIHIRPRIFMREVVRFLLNMQLPVLFYRDTHIVLKDSDKLKFDLNNEHYNEFLTRLKHCNFVEQTTPKKLKELARFLKSFYFQKTVEWDTNRIYGDDGLPEAQFILEIPTVLNDNELKNIKELHDKLILIYGEESVIRNKFSITVSGLELKPIEQVSKKVTHVPLAEDQSTEHSAVKKKRKNGKNDKRNTSENNNNNNKADSTTFITSVLRPLTPDEIADKANKDFPNYIFKPLYIPGREDGKAFARYNPTAIDTVLQKDKKNYVMNSDRVNACLRLLDSGRVKGNGSHHKDKSKKDAIVSSNEICQKGLAIFDNSNNNNNNNNNQPKNMKPHYAHSFFKIKHDNDRFYATTKNKIEIKDEERSTNISIEAYDFDYFRFDVHS